VRHASVGCTRSPIGVVGAAPRHPIEPITSLFANNYFPGLGFMKLPDH